MPGDAGTCRHGSELVNNVTWNEVNVVVMETKVSITDAVSS